MMASPLLKLGMDWKVECLDEASLWSDVKERRRDKADDDDDDDNDSVAEVEFVFKPVEVGI